MPTFKLKSDAGAQTGLKLKAPPAAQPGTDNYARSLRAIGQDLTQLYPEELEIQVSGNKFLAAGVGLTSPPDTQETPDRVLQRVWKRLKDQRAKRRAGTARRIREPFIREYDPDAINRLDELGITMRVSKEGKPDIYSLGERLRTVGRIVDSCGGTLIRIVKDRNSMKFEYRDQDGIERKEEYTNLALYKYQQRYYAKRGIYVVIGPWDQDVK